MEKWWQADDWRRTFGVPAAVLVGTVLLGALIGSQLAIDGGGSSGGSALSRLDALSPGTLEPLPKATPAKLDAPRSIGSRNAGIAVTAVSEPDSIDTADGRRRAPDGGTLVVFSVSSWSCEAPPCKPWTSLDPQVQVDGLVKALPKRGSTFVVAAPAGTLEIRLVVDDSEYRQSVSLLSDNPGSGNIVLLEQRNPTRKLTLDKRYRLTEQTDIQFRAPDGSLANRFVRTATIESAQRRFFYGDQRPSTPRRAFLVVSASYTYPGRTQRYAFATGEISFRDQDGTRFPAVAVPGSSLLTFEIPGATTSGTLVVGGTASKTASNGVPYTATISTARVPLKF